MFPKIIKELEKELKETKVKHQFASDSFERLGKDVEQLELEIRDIEADIRRASREVDRTSYAAIKWSKDN